MSAIIINKAYEALALGEDNKQEFSGKLQGHKAHTIGYYLLAAGSLIASVAVVALTIAALATAIFTLYIFAGACLVIGSAYAIAAYILHRVNPGKELEGVIEKLCDKVQSLYKNVQDFYKTPLPANDETDRIKSENAKIKEIFTKIKEAVLVYEKEEQYNIKSLQENLTHMMTYLEDKCIDTKEVKKLKQSMTTIQLNEDFANFSEYMVHLKNNNKNVYQQILLIINASRERFNNLDNQLQQLHSRLALDGSLALLISEKPYG